MQKNYKSVVDMKCGTIMSSFVNNTIIADIYCDNYNLYSQGKTGYCWLVSALFCISKYIMKNKGISITFSKSYLIFCDKLEKAYKFLDKMIEYIQLPLDNIDYTYTLNNAMTDKGQWAMAENLIKKYGVIPNECCPDHSDRISTNELNACLAYVLRIYAKKIRETYLIDTHSLKPVYELKKYAMQIIYNLLVDFFGFHINDPFVYNGRKIHPKNYYKNYIQFPFDDYVSIFADDSDGIYKYEIDLDGNVSNLNKNSFVNVPNSMFSELVEKQINKHGFCWCSGDAGKFYIKSKKLFDDSAFDLSSLIYNEEYINLNRVNILKNHIAGFSHAMTIIETKGLTKGYLLVYDSAYSIAQGQICYMSRSWFEKFVFQAVIEKELLPDGYLDSVKLKNAKPWEFFHIEI